MTEVTPNLPHLGNFCKYCFMGTLLVGAPCFCFVFDLLIHGSDCIRSNTLKNGMPEAAASKLPTSPIFQKDLTFLGSSI